MTGERVCVRTHELGSTPIKFSSSYTLDNVARRFHHDRSSGFIDVKTTGEGGLFTALPLDIALARLRDEGDLEGNGSWDNSFIVRVERAGRSAHEDPPDVKPVQVSSDTRCYVDLLIKGTGGKQMEAQALADTGFTRDLLISEYKANELGLSPDGYVITATAAGGSQLTMHRYRSVAVAVHVEDKFGNKSYINEFMLECWALPGTDKPNSTVTGILAPSPTLDASCFTDCALTVEPSTSSPAEPSTFSPAKPSTSSPAKPSTSSPAKPSMSAHETEGGVYRISPVRLGQDRYGHDILLGRSGMLRLKLGFDKSTGDMICTLHSPDAVL